MNQDHIDRLLERYLSLLDEYSQLRQELSSLQTSIFQDIARANYSGERGRRYGRDDYDERMAAQRLVNIDANSEAGQQHAVFSVEPCTAPSSERSEKSRDSAAADSQDHNESKKSEASMHEQGDLSSSSTTNSSSQRNDEGEVKEKKQTSPSTRDPIRWFGLFVPQPLRSAQASSIKVVEHLVPRLTSVDAEMKCVEIEIRRARKKRAKAAATDAQLASTSDPSQTLADKPVEA